MSRRAEHGCPRLRRAVECPGQSGRRGGHSTEITKSVSRFARNTVDSLTTIRRLKEKGVGVTFEKENIDTLDSKGS